MSGEHFLSLPGRFLLNQTSEWLVSPNAMTNRLRIALAALDAAYDSLDESTIASALAAVEALVSK